MGRLEGGDFTFCSHWMVFDVCSLGQRPSKHPGGPANKSLKTIEQKQRHFLHFSVSHWLKSTFNRLSNAVNSSIMLPILERATH